MGALSAGTSRIVPSIFGEFLSGADSTGSIPNGRLEKLFLAHLL
jgi:hypothetical protein